MAIQPQTELEAVNIILSSVGESPVNALGSDLSGNAEAVLNEVMREIQERGWHFNTEEDYDISVAVGGTVTLPDNVASYKLDSADVVMRGNRLYDRRQHSYTVFSGTVTGTIVFLLAWTELPPTARRLFTMEAAHRYQKRWFSSETLVGFTAEDIRKAKVIFEDAESIQAGYNILNGSYGVYRTLDRKSGSEHVR